MSVIPMAAKSPKPGRGGTRSGAGRPRKAPILLTPPDGQDRFGDAQAFLLALLNADDASPTEGRRDAAALSTRTGWPAVQAGANHARR